MKSLKQQAEVYFDSNIFCDGITPFEEDISKRCFIAGATSNWVQVEKIKAQIEILRKHRLSGEEKFSDAIEELEQQLKELTNLCKCGRRDLNTLSGICDECWNDIYPNEQVELKD